MVSPHIWIITANSLLLPPPARKPADTPRLLGDPMSYDIKSIFNKSLCHTISFPSLFLLFPSHSPSHIPSHIPFSPFPFPYPVSFPNPPSPRSFSYPTEGPKVSPFRNLPRNSIRPGPAPGKG